MFFEWRGVSGQERRNSQREVSPFAAAIWRRVCFEGVS